MNQPTKVNQPPMNQIDHEHQSADILGASGLTKIGSLTLFGVIFALLFSWFFRSFLLSGEWVQLLWSSLGAIGFLVVFTLQTFFIRSTSLFALAFLLQSLGLISFFFTFSVPVMTLFVAVYGLLLSASVGGRKILDNTLRIDFWNISKLIVPKGIIAITLLVSVFIPLHLQAHRETLPLSLATFDKVMASSNGFIRRFYKDFDSSKSVEEVARTATEQQLQAIPQAQNLPPQQKNVLVKKAMSDLYVQIFNYTGVQIDPKDPISKAVYGVLQEKFKGLKDEAKLWVFIVFGSIIFVSIASIMLPIRIVVAVLAFLVYESMLALGFARVTIEQKSKETFLLD